MRVVGLDLHPDRICAVEVDTAFGRFEIRDMHELPVTPDTNPEAVAARLLNSLPKKINRLVVGAPTEITTFRNLQIASKDKKAIKAALEFELEDDLPFERESLHYDSVTLSSGVQGSMIHVGATKKEIFSGYVEGIKSFGIDPDVITTDPWAYRTLLQRISAGTPVMLVGIERNRTFFYVHDGHRPILYRDIQFGLKKIEQILEQDYGATQGEIHQWIRDVGVTGIDPKVSASIEEALEVLVPELKQTELASRVSLKSTIDQIWITGEGALMPGMIEWFINATGKNTSLFKPLGLISQGAPAYSEMTEVRFAKALALGMSTIPLDKLHPVNLRKGEFRKDSAESDSTWEKIKKPLPFILVVAVVFFTTKLIELQYYKGRLDETDETLKRAVKNYVSITTGNNLSDNATRNYLADPDKLKTTIQSDLSKEREMSKLFSPNKNSPFDFLKMISQKIGKDVVVDMIDFTAGEELNDAYRENRPFKASLSFLVANPQVMAKLSDLMEKTFKLKKGASEEITQEGRKLFKVSFSGMIEVSK